MFEPIPLNSTYRLGGYQFVIYNIDGFDFQEELNLPHTNGIYCFSIPLSDNGANSLHVLQYLGKTQDFAERFDRHHRASDLLRLKPLCISVYYCENNNEEERIEKQLLLQYSFPLNVVDNRQFPKDLPTIVRAG